jgi:hypothetical protein
MGTEEENETSRPDSDGIRKRFRRIASLGPGGLFAGRYEVLESLGSGGAGEVFRALDTTAGIDVALKILYPGAEPSHDLDRLRREVRILRSLRHRGIVKIFDIGEVDGVLYAVSELLEGESLAERLRRDGALPADEAERILRRVLEALATAHAAGVVHRDIKPANIFLASGAREAAGSVLLLDFGLARSGEDSSLTATGHFVGTPEYCAPEQVRGRTEVSPATDLYACGITLWAMLSGKPPFRGDSQFDVLNAHVNAPPPPAKREMPHAPPRLRAFALACLEKSMADRPPDAAEALRMLDTPVSLWKRGRFLWLAARGLTRRRRWLVALAAGGTLALAAVVYAALWLLTPIGVRHQGKQVLWKTRSGWEIASSPFEQPVASIRMVEPWLGPFGRAYIGVWGQAMEGKPWRARPPFPPMLYFTSNILAGARPVFSTASALALEEGFYPNLDPAYFPAALLDLPGVALGEGPRLVMDAAHVVSDSARLVGTDEFGKVWFTYDHPGSLHRLATFSPASGPPLILAAGANFLLGPRNVVVALRAGEHPPGQGPPYVGPRTREDIAAYHLFLPHELQIDTRLHLEGETGVVELEGRSPLRFHAATGIPTEASDRGGLSEQAWDARRRRLLEALFKAGDLRDSGQSEAGARLLEEFAAEDQGSPELLSIALYRAARIRMRQAAGPEVPRAPRAAILEQALDDVSRAIALETQPHVPSHYPIVQADLLLRLGRASEARRILDDWIASPSAMGGYFYPWLLLEWRAGKDPPLSLVLARLPDDTRSYWPALIRLADAVHRADFAAGRGEAEKLNRSEIQCDTQHYWAARSYLDGPSPDPSAALAHLDRAEESFKTGVQVPFVAARLRAQLLRDPGHPPDASAIERARRDLDDTAECAAASADCLALLEYGERDLAAVTRALGRR